MYTAQVAKLKQVKHKDS